MNQTDRLERDLTAWFVETAAPRTPDFLDDILAQTAGTRQRAAWSFPERWIPMSVITLGRRTIKPVPWRTVALLVALALLIMVAAALYAGSQHRVPAPFGPARNGDLVLAEAGDIVVLDPGTGSRRVVVGGPAVESGPVFSRQGTRLAFFRETAGVRDLWVADVDGTNQRQLKTQSLADLGDGIDWSPDGRSIMLASSVDGAAGIAIVSAEGGDPHVLHLEMPAEPMGWRPPDGKEILFRGQTATGYGLFAVRLDGSGPRPVTPADGTYEWAYRYSSWSPDGLRILFQWAAALSSDGLGQHLYVVAADGTDTRQVTVQDSSVPAWSPDGRSILFSDTGAGPTVYIVPSDGRGSSRPIGPIGTDAYSVGWTPDGTRILFLAEGSDAPLLLHPERGTSDPAPWTSASFPDWQRLASSTP